MSKADEQIRMQANGVGDSLVGTIYEQRRRMGRLWVLRCILFVGALASLICAVAVAWGVVDREVQPVSVVGESAITPPVLPEVKIAMDGSDQLLPHTEAGRELEKILQGSYIDLALVNWLVAADIPEFRDMTRDAYFKQLDAMTEQVRQDIAKMQKVAVARGENVNAAKTRCAIFCNAIIIKGSVLGIGFCLLWEESGAVYPIT